MCHQYLAVKCERFAITLVYCSVLHCFAAYCSVLQCVAVYLGDSAIKLIVTKWTVRWQGRVLKGRETQKREI